MVKPPYKDKSSLCHKFLTLLKVSVFKSYRNFGGLPSAKDNNFYSEICVYKR